MSATFARIDIAALASKSMSVDSEITIGKDVLELLAGAMYVDPLSVYREYIQNAADSIDDARSSGLSFPENALVEISINHQERSVVIRDFGAGICKTEFSKRLTSIGASCKRGSDKRGFRGVGRLAGLGYCQELVFRSRSEGEGRVHEMHWDGRILRERLRDNEASGALADLVREVATVKELPATGFPERFFEVELRKVTRIKNDLLMNEDAVRQYLSQVAPVPFSDEFKFGGEIGAWLNERGAKRPISVTLNDGKGPVFHRATSTFPLSPSGHEEFRGVQYFEHFNSDGEQLSFGWLLDHSYSGAFPRKLGLGGLRLRTGDMQIGDESITSALFPETRFSSWIVGDIHVTHPRIRANGRRDEFEPSSHYGQLQDELKEIASNLTRTIRTRSAERNNLRNAKLQLMYASSWFDTVNSRNTSDIVLAAAVKRAREFAKNALVQLGKLGKDHPAYEVMSGLVLRQLRKCDDQLVELGTLKDDPAEERVDVMIAAITTVLESSFKPAAVLPLAESILLAMRGKVTV